MNGKCLEDFLKEEQLQTGCVHFGTFDGKTLAIHGAFSTLKKRYGLIVTHSILKDHRNVLIVTHFEEYDSYDKMENRLAELQEEVKLNPSKYAIKES